MYRPQAIVFIINIVVLDGLRDAAVMQTNAFIPGTITLISGTDDDDAFSRNTIFLESLIQPGVYTSVDTGFPPGYSVESGVYTLL